ncbi:MAG: ArnT family glycosyltransferase [Stenotrophomonas sp.]
MRELKQEAPYAAMVMLGFALVGYFFFTGLYCSDDTRYLIGAIKVAVGEPISVASLAERRAMFLLPGAMLYRPDASLEWMIVPYALLFVVLGLAGYLAARQFLGRWAATVGMALAAAQPVFFLYAGAMLPDLSSTLFLIVGLLYLCRWVHQVIPSAGGAQRDSRGAAFLLGLSMALAFTIKESGLVLMPVVAAVMILAGAKAGWGRFLRDVALAAAGFLLLLGLEALLFKAVAGQWYSSVGSLLVPHDLAGFADSQGHGVIDRLKTLKMVLGGYTTLLCVLAGMSTLQLFASWLRGRMSWAQALTWLALVGFWLWPLLYFTFGSASLKSYLLPVMQQRYYAPSIIPAAILVAHLGAVVIRQGRLLMPAWIPVATMGLCLLVLLSAPYRQRHERGLIYDAPAKEAFRQAERDMRRRYPGIPFHDVHSGSSTDQNRCRALLMPVRDDGSNRLMTAIHSGADLRGDDFGYQPPVVGKLPILVAGNGAYMDDPKAFPWVAAVQSGVASGQMKLTLVGRYGLLSPRALRGKSWLPRTVAGEQADVLAPTPSAEEAARPTTPQQVEVYLVEAVQRR